MSRKIGTELRYGTAEEAGMLQERLDIAKNLTKKWVDQDILNSAVHLVARHGIIVLHEAFGKVTYEPDSSLAELDTIYLMTSLTKPVTAASLMCLVEDGLVGINHPVVDYIPEFVGDGKDKVLVRQLLTHTSGITDEDTGKYIESKRGKVEIPTCEPTQHPQLNEFYFLMYDVPLSFPTGKEMQYADWNYNLIGEIVRRVSGKSLESFTRERIFVKLGMNNSYFEPPNEIKSRIAIPINMFPPDSIEGVTNLPSGCCGLITTAMDMAIFTRMFLNKGMYGDKRIISPPSVYEMTHNQIPGIPAKYGDEYFPEANWSYGWGMARGWFDGGVMHSPKAFSHGGWGTCYLWGDPEYNLVGAFFATSNNAERGYREHGLFVNVVMSAIDD
ncbi:TPA: class A beta-lactamase-related serine hydrolase [bacterium]|nr:class A beta-lactamase-related serine hydrolase [bacterium]